MKLASHEQKLAFVFLAFAIAASLGGWFWQQSAVIPVLIGMLGILIAIQLKQINLVHYLRAEVEKEALLNYRELEALISLYKTVPVRKPLPAMRGWAASPDFCCLLASTINEHHPRVIVETGSGVSTLISAYCFQQFKGGHIYSLDHEEEYAENTRHQIALHQLEEFATVFHSPLQKTDLENGNWQYYDLSCLSAIGSIDMLVVDGPPNSLQPLSRYPLLPLLAGKLSPNVVILMDDTIRPDEKRIATLWAKAFDLSLQEFPLEKGAILLRRQARSAVS